MGMATSGLDSRWNTFVSIITAVHRFFHVKQLSISHVAHNFLFLEKKFNEILGAKEVLAGFSAYRDERQWSFR